jgi:hypothetical protein
MLKCPVTLAVLVLSGAPLQAAEGDPMLQFNDQRFAPRYAYAFHMEVPDLDAMPAPKDLQDGSSVTVKMKWKKSLAIALSDKPFDTAALAKLDSPLDALDKMVGAGAMLVTVVAGKSGKIDAVRVCLPRSQTALTLDPSSATLTLDSPKDGKLSGRLVIKGDHKMHEFDPQNVPLVESDIHFMTLAPAR